MVHRPDCIIPPPAQRDLHLMPRRITALPSCLPKQQTIRALKGQHPEDSHTGLSSYSKWKNYFFSSESNFLEEACCYLVYTEANKNNPDWSRHFSDFSHLTLVVSSLLVFFVFKWHARKDNWSNVYKICSSAWWQNQNQTKQPWHVNSEHIMDL